MCLQRPLLLAVWAIMFDLVPLGADEVYVGGGRLPWRSMAATQREGAIHVTVDPTEGNAPFLLVLGKPAWMVLEDADSPVLRSLAVNGKVVQTGVPLRISSESHGPLLEAVMSDATNPVAPESVRLSLEGRVIRPTNIGIADRELTATYDLSEWGVGTYKGTLEARDLSPASNLFCLPVLLSVNGRQTLEDGKTVVVSRAGHKYLIGGSGMGQAFLRFEGTDARAYLSTAVNGKFVYAREIVALHELETGDGVRLVADVIGIENQDFGQIAELEFDVRTEAEFPGIIVTSRARNLDADGVIYCFWGWLPGQGFVTPDGTHEWSLTYKTIGAVGWVFLPPTLPDAPGIGVITPLPFGESRFGTLLIYTEPQKIEVARGEAVVMPIAFMLCDSAEQVAAAHAMLVAKGLLEPE
ncbi:MAG: hypothetical protein ACUVX8_01945 [Candidatus Zipacnadales bacterium]